MVYATIDSSIHLNPNHLEKDALDSILSRLTIPNPAKKIAKREMLYGADSLPSSIKLYKYNSHNELVLPRGFVFDLESIVGIHWEDANETMPYRTGYCTEVPEIPLRDYQHEAASELMGFANGIYKAPTGSGKTRVMLEVIRQCEQKTIVFVEKKDIAYQWMKAAEELGYASIGIIGEGSWDDEMDLTIALRQSVYPADMRPEWFWKFGMVIVDECHHCAADTMFELVQKFPAYYRFGCSATPDSDPDIFPIARAVLGPVIHTTSEENAQEALVIPSVKVVETDFEFEYHPTVRVGKKVVRNNYGAMMTALEKNEDRNSLIVNSVYQEAEQGHCCLVISKRKNHLNELMETFVDEFGGEQFDSRLLTGDNSSDYEEILEAIENSQGGFILFSTLAEEGTDIPKLDRLFLAYPGRKLRGFEQAIGRVMRPHPEKQDAIVYDFRDVNASLLNSQFRERAHGIYNKKGYKVECPK